MKKLIFVVSGTLRVTSSKRVPDSKEGGPCIAGPHSFVPRRNVAGTVATMIVRACNWLDAHVTPSTKSDLRQEHARVCDEEP